MAGARRIVYYVYLGLFMKRFLPSAVLGAVIVLTLASCTIGLILLLDMRLEPASSWEWSARALMITCAVIAIFLGRAQWHTPVARLCALLSALVLIISMGVFVWGGYSAQIAQPC